MFCNGTEIKSPLHGLYLKFDIGAINLRQMDTIFRCWVSFLKCVIYASALFTYEAYCGEFLYFAYDSASQPNNTEAQSICRSNGSELAIINTQAEYDRMYSFFNKTLGPGFYLPDAVWIGLFWVDTFGNGTYTHFWESCSGTFKLDWSYWDADEPNGMGYEVCVRIHTNMYMRTIGCSGSYDVLCEKIDSSNLDCDSSSSTSEECEMFTSCWWTPAKVGLTAGFTSLFFLFCLCCIGWKCFCAPKNQIGYEADQDDDVDDDVIKDGGHDINKNYNMDHSPDLPPTSSGGINSVVLSDNSWMTPEELSFSARYSYKEK